MSPKRILLVDDDPAVTRSLKLNSECTLRYDVRTENDARCVLPAARQFHPDLAAQDAPLAASLTGQPLTTSPIIQFSLSHPFAHASLQNLWKSASSSRGTAAAIAISAA